MNQEQLTQEINNIEKAIRATDSMRTEALTKKKMYEDSLAEQRKEFEALGTTPEKAAEKREELENKIKANMEFINKNLPIELLKKWGKL